MVQIPHTTHIDSVALRVELHSAEAQRARMNEMLTYISSIGSIYINHQYNSFGEFSRVEHRIYSYNLHLATISSGSFQSGANRDNKVYFIKIVVAGLRSYDEYADTLRGNLLFTICSWLNKKRLSFRLNELDFGIDAECTFEHFHTMQVRRVPNVHYNQPENQIYLTTHYLQRVTKTKSTSAVAYDKQHKEELENFLMSRFEIRLPSSFFKKRLTLEDITNGIATVVKRYAICYIDNLHTKGEVLMAQQQIEQSLNGRARSYDRLIHQLQPYMLYIDIQAVVAYIRSLYSTRDYKMVVTRREPIVQDNSGDTFTDEDWVY